MLNDNDEENFQNFQNMFKVIKKYQKFILLKLFVKNKIINKKIRNQCLIVWKNHQQNSRKYLRIKKNVSLKIGAMGIFNIPIALF